MVLRNPGLRRVIVSYGSFIVAEYAVWIAMLVFAYARGGATAAGLIAVAQLVPAAMLAPFLAAVADRRPPVQVMVGGYAGQAAGMCVTAVSIYFNGPPVTAYAGAVVAATCVVAVRPAQAPLVPALAHSTEELTAANAVLGWVESTAVVSAGALTGIALIRTGVGFVFAVCSGLALLSLIVVSPLRTPPLQGSDDRRASVVREVISGCQLLARSQRPRLLLFLLAAEWTVVGALDILIVVLALNVLGLGRSWVGLLNTALGLGGVIAGSFAILLVGRRLGPPIMIAAAGMSVPLLLITALPEPAVLVAVVLVIGAGQTMLDISTRTLLQRAVPAETLGRVFGVVEALTMAGGALGSLLTSLFVAVGGSTAALLATASVLPIAAVSGGRALFRLDAEANVPVVEIALLRSLRLFRNLPVPTIEGLAGELEPVHLAAGAELIREGEPGDRYYAIADGDLRIERQGRSLGIRSRGDGVGEIALLGQVPRTATVTAVGPATVYSLASAAFLAAVTGHAETSRTAHQVVQERLDDADPAAGSWS